MDAPAFREALAAIGMTQVAFAKKVGRNPRTIRRWALGERPIPDHIPLVLELLERDQKRDQGAAL